MQVEDLRLLLSQQKGVTVLVPLALAKFEQNPLTEGDFKSGVSRWGGVIAGLETG
jgi:hypothetical protein